MSNKDVIMPSSEGSAKDKPKESLDSNPNSLSFLKISGDILGISVH